MSSFRPLLIAGELLFPVIAVNLIQYYALRVTPLAIGKGRQRQTTIYEEMYKCH